MEENTQDTKSSSLTKERFEGIYFQPINFIDNELKIDYLLNNNLISVRLFNVLSYLKVEDIRDAFYYRPITLLNFSNFGRKTLRELETFRKNNFLEKSLSEIKVNPYYKIESKESNDGSQRINDKISFIKNRLNAINFKDQIANLNKFKKDLKEIKINVRSLERLILNFEDKNYSQVKNKPINLSLGEKAYKILKLIEDIIDTSIDNSNHANIIKLRLGIHQGYSKMTLQEIGQMHDVSRERIRQILSKSQKTLTYHFKKSDTYALRDLKELLSQLFYEQKVLNLEEMLKFCNEFYGNAIRIEHLISYVLLSLDAFNSFEIAKNSVINKNKELINKARMNFLNKEDEKSSNVKFVKIFNDTIFPKDQSMVTSQINGFKERVRDINKYSKGKIGNYYSQKCKKNIFYESEEELKVFNLLEKSTMVSWYQEQPIRIPKEYMFNGFNYVPDVLVFTNENKGFVLEIKNILDYVLNETVKKGICAKKYLEKFGIGYQITNSRLISFKDLYAEKIDKKFEEIFLNTLDKNNYINYEMFLQIKNKTELSSSISLTKIMIQNDLSFERYPFIIKKLEKGFSYKQFIK